MLIAFISLAVMGAIFGVVLAVASKKFAVEVDPRVEAIQKLLPGANCGSCGYPGCGGYAEAIVAGQAGFNACAPGGGISAQIAEIMGAAAEEEGERKIAQLFCGGGTGKAAYDYKYEGIMDCHAAVTQYKGPKACKFGCVGLGSCTVVCPFGAIKMGPEQLPEVDAALCTGCGVCVEHCPQAVLHLVGISKLVHVRCSNKDKAKVAKDSCTVACIKCKLCEKNCPEDAIHVISDASGSIAVIDYEKCTNCGTCVAKCPTKTIQQILPAAELCSPAQKQDSVNAGCAHCGICKQ